MCHLHSLWCGRRKLGAGSRVRPLLGVGPGSRAEWKEICWVRLITVMWGTWAGPPRDNRDIPRPRRWDVTRIGTGPRRSRAGAEPETRPRRASCANTELCTGTASAWHTWLSPGSGGMQLPNYSELFARLREGTILASCCYNFDYETFVD